jgi:hypothetical protein
LDSESRPFLVEPPAFLDAHRRETENTPSGIATPALGAARERPEAPIARAKPIAIAIVAAARAFPLLVACWRWPPQNRRGYALCSV